MLKKIALLLTLGVLLGQLLSAQVTTSSINGAIKSPTGEALAGATIRATHEPSGTVYTTVTQTNGTFSILGMRTGGPYKVVITYVGFEPKVINNVNLILGEAFIVNENLGQGQSQLQEVTVTATGRNSILSNERTGASTNINARQLTTLPTISRSLTDFTRLTPQANGNSFAGRDNRMNSVKIDGATFNNSFGLSSDLLPGGDAQPISLDAVQEVQVNVAPYDVRQTGFTGAGVNAITRSGTNKFSGSVYGLYRNQNFNGTEVAGKELPEAAKTTNKVFGARFGGPIIKNKLFFFGNYEKSEYVFPGNTWVANRGNNNGQPNVSRTLATDLEAVSAFLKSEYGYDPGRYEGYANEYANKDEKFLVRFDWNINDKHKFTARYNQVIGTADQGTNASSGPNPRASNSRIGSESIAFENANYALRNVVRSGTIELNSTFSPKLSNQILGTYTYIESLRSTPGELFPFVDIWEGGKNYMSFGTELFSYNNGLKNTNISFIDNLTYQTGKHTLTGGLSLETMGFDNSYVRLGTSYYRYNTVADFLAKRAPSVYGVTYPFQDDTWAKVRFGLGGLYAQDKVTLSDRLNVTVGLRADLPLYFNEPLANPSVDTLRLLDRNGNPTTYSTATWPKSRVLLSPRVGVNYDVFGDRSLQIRGGSGIFTGLIPFVWFTNQPTNSGMLQNTFEPVNAATLAQITRFEKNPYYWVNALPNAFPKTAGTKAPGTIALIDEDFKMPQIWRTNIGADYKIPATPLVATVDFIYSKDINAVYQFNANRKQAPTHMKYSGDNRAYWISSANATYNSATGAIVPVLSNTDQGYSASITAGISLPYRKGLSGSVFYTYTAAEDVTGNPGSAANSAWSNNYSINDPNELYLSQSQFAIPHRVVGNLSYRIEYVKHLATTVSLFYQGSHAGRFAYTYDGDINRDGVTLDLLYIPQNASELTFSDIKSTSGEVMFSAAQQQAAFANLVNSQKGLKDAKGGYVARNSGLLPWYNRFDVRLLQDIFTNIGKDRHTLQLSVDIMNAGNMINSDWGVRQELNTGSQYNYALLKVASVSAAGVPTFQMQTVKDEAGKTVLPATPFRNWFGTGNTWSMQVGLRYTF
jgi:hypothetical protein